MSICSAPGITKDRRRAIAARVRDLHLELWNNRSHLWSNPPESPLHVVDPGVALEYLGYRVSSADLGQEYLDGQLTEVAGVIDFKEKSVCLSIRPSREEQFFTAAHELGHAVLHPGRSALHRDRPVDGPGLRKNVEELEADYFASCFLLPEKRVRNAIRDRFLLDHVKLDQQTALGLCDMAISGVRSRIRSVRDFSRLIAECQSYDGRKFRSLKGEYLVSTTAMAIRLEELDLVSL